MLYNSLNLEVAKIASKSEARPEIAGVLFTKDKTVATDGFRLLEITTPANVKPEDFPIVDGITAMRGCRPFIVPVKALREIKIPKESRNLPIISNVAIKHIDDNRVEFLTTDLEMAKITKSGRIGGKFPDYEQIFPTAEPVAQVIINGRFLVGLLEIMAKLDKTQAIKVKFYGPDKPIVLEAGNENQRSRGLIMPIKDN